MSGQASGNWTESSSALRILNPVIRNSNNFLCDDGFTQTNPPVVTTTSTISTAPGMRRLKPGVLSGSVAFTRPDAGSNYVGGPRESVSPAYLQTLVKPVGLFINDAGGYNYENLPAVASGVAPYVCGGGVFGSRLFETQFLAAVGAFAQGDAMTYLPGVDLIASRNGYLMPRQVNNGGTLTSNDLATTSAQAAYAASSNVSTTLAVLKMVPDASRNEIVFDLRV
jgi:hypothetical protein